VALSSRNEYLEYFLGV